MSNDRSRTIVLATLMIAALISPVLSATEERVEMKEEPILMEAPPDPVWAMMRVLAPMQAASITITRSARPEGPARR